MNDFDANTFIFPFCGKTSEGYSSANDGSQIHDSFSLAEETIETYKSFLSKRKFPSSGPKIYGRFFNESR